jgi:chorismate-pyruvate lyase
MKVPSPAAGPSLDDLLSLFPLAGDFARTEVVAAARVPQPYRRLLVHEHHMTVTVEAHHGDRVDVRILDRRQTADWYARKILLTRQGDGVVVQYGIMRVHLRFCGPEVRAEIVAGRTPLGRILIEHDVLRRIEPTAFLRVVPGPDLVSWFGLDAPRPTYGRLAYIHCNEQPAIELLEVVAPE